MKRFAVKPVKYLYSPELRARAHIPQIPRNRNALNAGRKK